MDAHALAPAQRLEAARVAVLRLRAQRDDAIEELERARQQNAALQAELQARATALQELEQRYKVLKLARAAGATEESAADVKRKINEFIKEIDACLALLGT